MITYDRSFARRFAEVAESTISQGRTDVESHRVVAYISRVSMELSLKAFLERAGVPVSAIRRHSHDFRALLAEVCKCEVEVEIAPGTRKWVAATRVQAVDVGFQGHTATLGVILQAEDHGASKYPNELRYGAAPKDFPAEALAKAATALADWVEQQWNSIRKP